MDRWQSRLRRRRATLVRLDRPEMRPGTSGQSGKTVSTYFHRPRTDQCPIECKTRIISRMEQSEHGREGLKKEERRQDRHLEKGVMRSVGDDPELRRAEEEHERELVEIENEDGPRGCEASRDK